MNDRHALPRRLLYAAAAFFAAVILYFLWSRPWSGPPVPPPKTPPPAPMAPAGGGDAALPSYLPGVRVDRVEKRKYRREGGSIPTPAARR